ncbi:hypothetical protein ILUMI_25850 [Ignelater luminosus]|uniref:Phorbol-ester/DAG-type domain-containing protein n=1 Tax=Ignelater luminosus TaxID=2038154 RepID=A0A8K0C7M1_IGNLU|nr:hypothetical protein ILUMI_25850 [Ignelater luminosus]
MRTYKRKTAAGSIFSQQLNDAAKAVMNEGKNSESGTPSIDYAAPRQVFFSDQENSLKKILLTNGINLLWIFPERRSSPCLRVQAEKEAGTSYKENVQFDPSQGFSPEIVLPYPRKIGTAIRRKRKATILTDTSEKNALQEEQNKTTKKVKKQKQKIDKKRRKVLQSSKESKEDDYACLVYCEVYSESLPGQKWIQCQVCKELAHTKCAPNAGLTWDETLIVTQSISMLNLLRHRSLENWVSSVADRALQYWEGRSLSSF